MTTARESSIQRSCIAYLRTLAPGVAYRKIRGDAMGVKGDPDLIICANGRTLVIELKRPGWTMPANYWHTPQGRRLKVWEASGAATAIVMSRDELVRIIESL